MEQFKQQFQSAAQQCIVQVENFLDVMLVFQNSYDGILNSIDTFEQELLAIKQSHSKYNTKCEIPNPPVIHIKVGDYVPLTPTDIEMLRPLKQIHKLQEEEDEPYVNKEDLYEILASIQDVDQSLYKEIIRVSRKEKTSDILGFLSQKNKIQLDYSLTNKQDKIKDVKKLMRKIDHPFSQNNYSTENYDRIRLELVKKINGNKRIIDLLRFLVNLTSLDDTFIQCGSNSLNLLVEINADTTNQSFENIKIKDASLIGGNFFGCNFSGSSFDNVDISGMNLNGA